MIEAGRGLASHAEAEKKAFLASHYQIRYYSEPTAIWEIIKWNERKGVPMLRLRYRSVRQENAAKLNQWQHLLKRPPETRTQQPTNRCRIISSPLTAARVVFERKYFAIRCVNMVFLAVDVV